MKTKRYCLETDCDRNHHSRGYCQYHYKKYWRDGKIDIHYKGRPRKPNGEGRHLDKNGYVLVRNPDKPESNRYVLEHRLVMSQYLGRKLSPRETVHHINGNKEDNNIENLQLRIGQHGPGQAVCCYDCGSRNIGYIALD